MESLIGKAGDEIKAKRYKEALEVARKNNGISSALLQRKTKLDHLICQEICEQIWKDFPEYNPANYIPKLKEEAKRKREEQCQILPSAKTNDVPKKIGVGVLFLLLIPINIMLYLKKKTESASISLKLKIKRKND